MGQVGPSLPQAPTHRPSNDATNTSTIWRVTGGCKIYGHTLFLYVNFDHLTYLLVMNKNLK